MVMVDPLPSCKELLSLSVAILCALFSSFSFSLSPRFSLYFGMKYMCTCLCYWTVFIFFPHTFQLNIPCLQSPLGLTYISYAPNVPLLASFTVAISWASPWVEWLVAYVLSSNLTLCMWILFDMYACTVAVEFNRFSCPLAITTF